MLGRLVTLLVSALMFTLIGTGAVPANAVNIGQEGCGPAQVLPGCGVRPPAHRRKPVQFWEA